MTRLLLLLLLLVLAAPVRAYSIVWGNVLSATSEAWAWADDGEGGLASDHDVATLPGHALPLRADAWAHFEYPHWGGSGYGTADVRSNRIQASAGGNDSEDFGRDGWGRAAGSFAREFRVLGGTDSTTVEIPIWLWASGIVEAGGNTRASWEAGVDGVSSIGAEYDLRLEGPVEHGQGDPLAWTGVLEFGRTYSFRGYGETSAALNAADLWMELPGVPEGAQPVPEPATWALLALALLPIRRFFDKKSTRA